MYVPLYTKDVIGGDCTRGCKHGLSMLHIHQRHSQSFNVSILHVIEHVSTMNWTKVKRNWTAYITKKAPIDRHIILGDV